jgi:hypothetical protein
MPRGSEKQAAKTKIKYQARPQGQTNAMAPVTEKSKVTKRL